MHICIIVGLLMVGPGQQQQKQQQQTASLPSLNRAVLQFAQDNFNKKVGNGQCWTLADQALAVAGARRPGRRGYGVYQFGNPLSKEDKLLPGDILQMRGVLFRSRNSYQTFPLHTAIVSKIAGSKIEMLNQNVGNDQTVRRTTIDLRSLAKGRIVAFRPQAR